MIALGKFPLKKNPLTPLLAKSNLVKFRPKGLGLLPLEGSRGIDLDGLFRVISSR